MGKTTSKYQFPYPDGTDTPDVPRDIKALAEAVDAKIASIVGSLQTQFLQTTVLPVPKVSAEADSLNITSINYQQWGTYKQSLTNPSPTVDLLVQVNQTATVYIDSGDDTSHSVIHIPAIVTTGTEVVGMSARVDSLDSSGGKSPRRLTSSMSSVLVRISPGQSVQGTLQAKASSGIITGGKAQLRIAKVSLIPIGWVSSASIPPWSGDNIDPDINV
jgi:hypothetical protein